MFGGSLRLRRDDRLHGHPQLPLFALALRPSSPPRGDLHGGQEQGYENAR